MRLWHEDLIEKLPRQQLLGQWRECIALLGNGWGRKHSTVDYVFKYNVSKLIRYSMLVADEMERRGYRPNRDKIPGAIIKRLGESAICYTAIDPMDETRYPEHNDEYLKECLANLKSKNVEIDMLESHIDATGRFRLRYVDSSDTILYAKKRGEEDIYPIVYVPQDGDD